MKIIKNQRKKLKTPEKKKTFTPRLMVLIQCKWLLHYQSNSQIQFNLYQNPNHILHRDRKKILKFTQKLKRPSYNLFSRITTNIMIQSNLGKKGFIWLPPPQLSSSSRKVMAAQQRNLDAGTEVGTMTKHCFLACSSWITQLTFLYTLPAQRWHRPLRPRPPTHINH